MELRGHTGSVHQLCWDPTHPEHLATASADKTVKIWDARSTATFPLLLMIIIIVSFSFQDGKCTSTIKTSGANINISWSPNGQYIAVGNKVSY